MKITGIIAEFNPFHNGHAHLLREARRLTGADILLVVMSGDFVQRGTPALLSKYQRAEAALRAGADLLVELPVYAATASAELFADGAVRLLTDLGADSFAFGCETGDKDISAVLTGLQRLAELLATEPEEYRTLLREKLAAGKSFPVARRAAVSRLLPDAVPYLDAPNTLLAVEYLKACIRRNSPLRPIIIPRIGSSYHASALPDKHFPGENGASGSISGSLCPSATALRKTLTQPKAELPADLARYMPPDAHSILSHEYRRSFPITENDCSPQLNYQLLFSSFESLCNYADVSESLAARILKTRCEQLSFSALTGKLKTRDITYTRVSRALTHILLQITVQNQSDFFSCASTPYARVLGMKRTAFPYLKNRAAFSVPLFQRLSETGKMLTPAASALLAKDLAGSELYRQIASAKYHTDIPSEYLHEILVFE